MESIVKVKKLRENAIVPKRATAGSAGADLYHCRPDELFHGYFLGYLWHADSDCYDDLCSRWSRCAADSHSGCDTCRIGLWRSLFSDLRYYHTGFHRSSLRTHPACGDTASVCYACRSCLCSRIPDCRIYADSMDPARSLYTASDRQPFYTEPQRITTFQGD